MNINNVNTLLNRISEKIQLYNESETNDLKKEETVNRILTLRDIELQYNKLYSKTKYLEEQSSNSFNRILYDSEVDGKDDVTFKQKILNQQHLYFITIDSSGNIFGHYHDSLIDRLGYHYDNKIFMFTFSLNHIESIKKYSSIRNEMFTFISFEDKELFSCCNVYSVNKIDSNTSSVHEEIENCFDGLTKKMFVQSTIFKTTKLKPKRVIVIRMGNNDNQIEINEETIQKQKENVKELYNQIPILEKSLQKKCFIQE